MQPDSSSEQEFTLSGYIALVCRLLALGYQAVSVEEAHPGRRHLLLRHDIDMCLDRAVLMATAEAAAGVSSVYFVLLRTEMYNVASSRGCAALARLVELGREVGLHLDSADFGDDIDRIERQASLECAILEVLAGQPVRSISFHRPAPALQGLDSLLAGRKHVYKPRYFIEMGYCSDSEGRFRFQHPLTHAAVIERRSLQLLTHPLWWCADAGETAIDKLERFRRERSALLVSELAANCRPYAAFLSGG